MKSKSIYGNEQARVPLFMRGDKYEPQCCEKEEITQVAVHPNKKSISDTKRFFCPLLSHLFSEAEHGFCWGKSWSYTSAIRLIRKTGKKS